MHPTNSTHEVKPDSSLNSQSPFDPEHRHDGRPWRSLGSENQLLDRIFGYRNRLLIAATLAAIAAMSWWTWRDESKYVGKFYLLLAPSLQDASTVPTLSAENEAEIATQTALLRSPQVLKPILEKLSVNYPDLNDANLGQPNHSSHSPLTIEQLEQTKIVEITYESKDLQKIQIVLDRLANGYVSYGTKSQQTNFDRQAGIVKKEVSQIDRRIAQSQKELDTFGQQYSLYDLDRQAKLRSDRLANLELEADRTQIQLQETTTLYEILEQQLKVTPEQAIAASDLSESPYYQNLVKQLQEIEIKLAQESTIFQNTSPNIQVLKEQQDNLKKLLQKEEGKIPRNQQGQLQVNSLPNALRLSLSQQYIQAANNIQVLQSRKTALEQQIETLKRQIEKLPLLARQYADLQQKFDREKNSLNQFLETQNKLQSEGTRSSSWQLLSKPQLSKISISPAPQKNLVLGLLAGLSLGLLLSVLVEMSEPVGRGKSAER